MTIMELGALGKLLGAIGVIITLIYLAVQIRQNTQSMNENRKLGILGGRPSFRLKIEAIAADGDGN